jgi:hypothetical protein
LAWLYTAPVVPGEKDPQIQRIEKMESDDIDPDLPDCQAEYIVKYLFDVGPVQSGGSGAIPLTCQEIQSWQEQSGIELHPWEFNFIRKLSSEYLIESQKAEKPDYPAPYQPKVTSDQKREAVAMKIDNLFAALKMADNK